MQVKKQQSKLDREQLTGSKLGNKEMGILNQLTCLLRNLYVGQKATVKTLYGTTDWFRIEKEVQQGCLLSPCIFNLAHHEKCRAV